MQGHSGEADTAGKLRDKGISDLPGSSSDADSETVLSHLGNYLLSINRQINSPIYPNKRKNHSQYSPNFHLVDKSS